MGVDGTFATTSDWGSDHTYDWGCQNEAIGIEVVNDIQSIEPSRRITGCGRPELFKRWTVNFSKMRGVLGIHAGRFLEGGWTFPKGGLGFRGLGFVAFKVGGRVFFKKGVARPFFFLGVARPLRSDVLAKPSQIL